MYILLSIFYGILLYFPAACFPHFYFLISFDFFFFHLIRVLTLIAIVLLRFSFFFFYFIFSLYFFFPSLSTTTSLVDSHSCKNFHQSEFQIAMFHNPHRTLQSLLCIFIYMYVVFKVLTPLDSFENYGDSSKRTHKNIAKKKINKYIFL